MTTEQAGQSNAFINTKSIALIAGLGVLAAGWAWHCLPPTIDLDPGPPRLNLELDVTKGERLHEVKRGRGDQADQVAFVLAQGSDRKLWFEGRLTEVVSTVQSVYFYRRAKRREMIATITKGSKTHLLASSGEAFILSPALRGVEQRTNLRGDERHFAWIASDQEGSRVLFFDGAAFRLGEPMSSMHTITAMKDGSTVTTEGLYKGAAAYGYDEHVFSRHNGGDFVKLSPLGDQSFILLGRKPAGDWHVVIDHQISEAYEKIVGYKQAEQVPRSIYLGKRKDGWRILVESRVEGDEQHAEHGPFDWLGDPKRGPWLHDDNDPYDQFHYIAGRGENQHVGSILPGNTVGLSPAFKKVTFTKLKAGSKPLYRGTKDGTVAIIHGADAGADYDAIDQLRLIEKGANFAYVAKRGDDFIIADGTKALSPVAEVLIFNVTDPNEKLIAAVKTDDAMKVYHQDRFSDPVVEILGLKKLKDDGLAWKIYDGEGQSVVKDHKAGQRFEFVLDLNLSPGGRLWYDGIKRDQAYRVLDDQVGAPADRVTAPVFTPDDDRMVYGHMRRAADDQDPNQFLERWKVVDEKGAGRAFVRTPSKSAPQMAIRFEPWKNGKGASYHYVAQVDDGAFVGTDGTVYGPFQGIKEPTVSNDGSKISFFAQDDAGWHLHHKGALGAGYEQAFGLRFTVVGDHPRYTVRRGNQTATVIDDQLFHKIKAESINHARTVHLFAGHQDDGWHVVTNMTRSNPFEGVTKLSFGQDDHGLFAEVEKEGHKHLLHRPHEGEFVLGPAFDAVMLPSFYPDPVRSGQVTIDGSKVTLTPVTEEDRAEDDLARLAPETKLYLAYAYSEYGRTRQTGHRHVVARDNDTLTLSQPWSDEFIKAMAKRNARLTLHTVRVPYSYAVEKEGRRRVVYDNQVYKQVLNSYYGPSRTFYLHVKDELERWITDTTVHGGFDTIQFRGFEDQTDNDRYVLRVEEGKKSGYIIGDSKSLAIDFGRVDETTHVEWEPAGGSKERTIIWHGSDQGRRFQAFGTIRYDAIQGLGKTPRLKHTWYIGQRSGRYAVNIDGKEHLWYSQIPNLTDDERVLFRGDQDTATYHAINHYQIDADLSIDARTRSIHRLVVGDQETAKFHDLELLQSNDRLIDTQYLARSDEGWAHYRGTEAVSATYRDIAYVEKWEPPEIEKEEIKEVPSEASEKQPEPYVTAEATFHFIGQTEAGWVEVHDGSEGIKFRAFSSKQPDVTQVDQDQLAKRSQFKSVSAKSKASNDQLPRITYLPATGGYVYAFKKSDDHVLAHLGRTMVQADQIDQVWSFPSGKVAAKLKRGRQFQALYETGVSPLADKWEGAVTLDGDQFVAKLELEADRKILWSNKGQTKVFKSYKSDPKSIRGGTAWQAIVKGMVGTADGREGDRLAVGSDQEVLVQGSKIIAVADEMSVVEGTESDAGLVVKVKVKEKTARTTRDLVKVVTLLKKQKERLNTEPLDALEEVLSVWEDYGFAKDEDGRLSDDLDTVSDKNADHAFALLKKALKVDFEKIGDQNGEGRGKIDALLKPVREALKEELTDRYRIMVNGEMGPIFDEISDEIKVLDSGGLARTLYKGKRQSTHGDRWFVASNIDRYGPHEGIDSFGWAFGGKPFVVTQDGEKKALLIGDEPIYEGLEIKHFVRFGERTMLGATRSNTQMLFFNGQQVQSYISDARFGDQDLFLTAVKLVQGYDLWASQQRVAQATTIYEMSLQEDSEFGDSTLHWIEGDVDLEAEKVKVVQHQLGIPRVACNALQPIEVLIGQLDSNLKLPARKEKALIGTIGMLDEEADGRFIFTSREGASFNFGRGAAPVSKAKEWRGNREAWVGKTVEIEWQCVYHKPDARRARQTARAELIDMKLYVEPTDSPAEEGEAEEAPAKQP